MRLVGAPPQSIGKFGGDTDNWMWPRHTGDFSVFRVYAGPDNKPADYSPENKPYKADRFLRISLDGVDENDFAMIMGFPGSTERYMTSYEIDDMLGVSNPNRIFIRGERQAILWEDMLASDKVRIQYASKYARSSNYWKNSIGMSRGIEKLNVKARKQAQEAEFRPGHSRTLCLRRVSLRHCPKSRSMSTAAEKSTIIVSTSPKRSLCPLRRLLPAVLSWARRKSPTPRRASSG